MTDPTLLKALRNYPWNSFKTSFCEITRNPLDLPVEV